MKTIYLAGGCYWGVEHYFKQINGVIKTSVGFANGNTSNPTYFDVCKNNTGHAECVKVDYDETKVSLHFLLDMFYHAIDPTSLNKQGNDIGVQYRTGIYYTDTFDLKVINESIADLQKSYKDKIQIEVKPLIHYFEADESHQDYLNKHTNGYCHIPKSLFEFARNVKDNSFNFKIKDDETLKKELSDLQYNVTQNGATEKPFDNEYNSNFEKGIYVDVTTGEPLFISTDKFESGCGWPSFSKPIKNFTVKEIIDNKLAVERIEVKARNSNAHLGHVFNDGPEELGGLRYCINSAALKFIKKDKMKEEGYEEYLGLLDE
ncbi:MAG: peptide-methionine (R)-S-oxide reductase MsrB [Anaeroplasmataceae bacterium]